LALIFFSPESKLALRVSEDYKPGKEAIMIAIPARIEASDCQAGEKAGEHGDPVSKVLEPAVLVRAVLVVIVIGDGNPEDRNVQDVGKHLHGHASAKGRQLDRRLGQSAGKHIGHSSGEGIIERKSIGWITLFPFDLDEARMLQPNVFARIPHAGYGTLFAEYALRQDTSRFPCPGPAPGENRWKFWLPLISLELVERISGWHHSGFSIHSQVRAVTKREAERIGKYMIRPLLSLERLSFLEKEGKIS
jgi:hypothetical protein